MKTILILALFLFGSHVTAQHQQCSTLAVEQETENLILFYADVIQDASKGLVHSVHHKCQSHPERCTNEHFDILGFAKKVEGYGRHHKITHSATHGDFSIVDFVRLDDAGELPPEIDTPITRRRLEQIQRKLLITAGNAREKLQAGMQLVDSVFWQLNTKAKEDVFPYFDDEFVETLKQEASEKCPRSRADGDDGGVRLFKRSNEGNGVTRFFVAAGRGIRRALGLIFGPVVFIVALALFAISIATGLILSVASCLSHLVIGCTLCGIRGVLTCLDCSTCCVTACCCAAGWSLNAMKEIRKPFEAVDGCISDCTRATRATMHGISSAVMEASFIMMGLHSNKREHVTRSLDSNYLKYEQKLLEMRGLAEFEGYNTAVEEEQQRREEHQERELTEEQQTSSDVPSVVDEQVLEEGKPLDFDDTIEVVPDCKEDTIEEAPVR